MPRAPYLKGAFRSTILMRPSTRLREEFQRRLAFPRKQSSHVSDRQEGRSGRKVANKKGNKTHPKMSVGREAALLRPYHRRLI